MLQHLVDLNDYSQERNINRQYRTLPVVQRIVDAFTSIRELDLQFTNDSYDDDIKKINAVGIEAILKEELGIREVTIRYGNVDYINAFIITPRLDDLHVFNFTMASQYDAGSDQARLRFLKSKKPIKGYVDLKKVKLSGEFSQIPITLGFTIPLFKKDCALTVEEWSSYLFHEIGHLFTYYMYLGDIVSLSNTLSQLQSLYKGHLTHAVRVEILQYVKDDLDLPEAFDVGAVSKHEDGEIVKTMVATGFTQRVVSGTDSYWYDQTTSERLADQFVSRLGLGVPLATGLEKAHTVTKAEKLQSARTLIRRTILSAITLDIYPLVMFMTYATFQPNERYMRYDKFPERIAQIKKDIVASMKDSSLSKEHRKVLQEEYNTLVKIEARAKDSTIFRDNVWQLFNSDGRQHRKVTRLLTNLEELALNPLFAQANRLQTI